MNNIGVLMLVDNAGAICLRWLHWVCRPQRVSTWKANRPHPLELRQ